MKTIIKIILPIWLLFGCAEETLKPILDDDSIPVLVKDIKVENFSGAVKISYDVPKGVSLLYVEAEVDMGDGRIAKASSSYYNDFIELEGFGEAKEYDVALYSVGRNLKRSEPTVIKVNPLEPPIRQIFQSLEVNEDFGGLSIRFRNELEAEVSMVVDVQNADGEWETIETFYTKLKEGIFNVRGQDAVQTDFRIYINDRWGNRTQNLLTQLTPLFEEELDYTKFVAMRLPNDPTDFGANRIHFLWNNDRSGSTSGSGGWYRTSNGTAMPTQVTINMGQTVRLSRFKFWQRGTISEQDLLYAGGSPRVMEIWGSNAPNPDGTYDSWEKLIDVELTKPSGLPVGNNAPTDIEVADRGHEYLFPSDIPPVQYLRIRVLHTFGVTEYFWMSEIDLFGQIQ